MIKQIIEYLHVFRETVSHCVTYGSCGYHETSILGLVLCDVTILSGTVKSQNFKIYCDVTNIECEACMWPFKVSGS